MTSANCTYRVGSLLVGRDRWIRSATVGVRRGRIVGLASGRAAGARLEGQFVERAESEEDYMTTTTVTRLTYLNYLTYLSYS